METWHYQQTIKECKPFIFENYGYLGQTVNLAMKMFEAELIKHETWQHITELSHEKERLNYLLNYFLDPGYTNIKTAFEFLVEQFNTERYTNISQLLTVTLEKVKSYKKPPEEPVLEHLDRLHDNLSDLTPNQLKESVKKIRVQIVAEGFEKDAAKKQEIVEVRHTDMTSEDRHSTINDRDADGKTALMRVVEQGDTAEMSTLLDYQNLDLTVYDGSGLTFEYHAFGNSILKYMYIDIHNLIYIDRLKYSVPTLNFYEKLINEKSHLDWDKIMKVIELLLSKENVKKTNLLKSCITFGNEHAIETVLKSVLKTVVITDDIKDFLVDVAQTINPIVVKFLSQFEISLNTTNMDAIMYSIIRYNSPDTCAVLLEQLELASINVDKALKTVLSLQTILPGVLPHILRHSTFNLNERDKDGATVFMILCRFGSYETISKLLAQTDIKIDFEARDRFGHTCFMRALLRSTEDVFVLLLQNKRLAVIIKSVIHKDDHSGGKTLLIEAIKRGHVNSVSLIMDHGAKVNMGCAGGKTALMMASRWGQELIVEKFLSIASVDVNATDSNKQTALHEASIMEQDKIVKLLVNHVSININAVDYRGRTALYYACSCGYDNIVTHLITHNDIDINTKDGSGETALHVACQYGHDVVVSKLIGHSCVDINVQDSDNITALCLASSEGHSTIVARLIAHSDIEVNAGDIHGDTPLHKASSAGHQSVVAHLIGHSAIDVNMKNLRGSTPLHRACYGGHDGVVSRLIAHANVQINAKNNDCKTAGQVALTNCYDDIASQLMNLSIVE